MEDNSHEFDRFQVRMSMDFVQIKVVIENKDKRLVLMVMKFDGINHLMTEFEKVNIIYKVSVNIPNNVDVFVPMNIIHYVGHLDFDWVSLIRYWSQICSFWRLICSIRTSCLEHHWHFFLWWLCIDYRWSYLKKIFKMTFLLRESNWKKKNILQ